MTDIEYNCPHCNHEHNFEHIKYLEPYFGQCMKCLKCYAFFIRDEECAKPIFKDIIPGLFSDAIVTTSFQLSDNPNFDEIRSIIKEYIKNEVSKPVASGESGEQK